MIREFGEKQDFCYFHKFKAVRIASKMGGKFFFSVMNF